MEVEERGGTWLFGDFSRILTLRNNEGHQTPYA